jgi:steroid 5-alpha reductase family enzyme
VSVGHWLVVSGCCLVATAVAMLVTAVVARRTGRFGVVDVTWGLALALTSVVSAGVGTALGDGDWRRWLVLVLVSAWGLRLAWHVHRRNAGQEDRRYAELLEGASFGTALLKVFVVQGLAVWLVSLPLQVTAVTRTSWSWVAGLGAALWLVGVLFEAVGDAQLTAFKRDPDRGPVMDRGLWSWTRHPNYFGDACVWWGVWLVALAAWPGVLTVVSPVAMTYFLVFATGARLLEEHMSKRPGWDEYAGRTSMFFPLPPRSPRAD